MKKIYILAITSLVLIISANLERTSKYPEMIKVAGGTFKMGSEEGYEDEMPIHQVTVTDFYIGKYEVTVAEYREYCKATGSKFPSKPSARWYDEHDQVKKWEWKDKNPIVNVTWYEANAYCKWLSEETGDSYSLPTEAQWEYAAKGGNKSKGYKYAGSNNLNEIAWYDETTYERGARTVGTLKPNELGIYDMSGNAMEWCSDSYAKYSKKKQKNPQGGSSSILEKIIRGGSWFYVSEFCRTSQRDCPKANKTKFDYGFRVVKNI